MRQLSLFALFAALLMAACAPGNPAAGGSPVGMEWKLAEINGKPVLAGSVVTLELKDGKGGGNAGCNSYGGEYQLRGTQLSFGSLAMTEMACMDPAGVMEQETQYLQTLSQAAAFQMTGDRLEVKNASGETILVFQK